MKLVGCGSLAFQEACLAKDRLAMAAIVTEDLP